MGVKEEATELFAKLSDKQKQDFIDYLKELLIEQEQSTCSSRSAG